MKTCSKCDIPVNGTGEFCPLCGEALVALPGAEDTGAGLAQGAMAEGGSGQAPAYSGALKAPGNTYPDLSGAVAQYSFFRRLLLFLTLLTCGVSGLINWLVTPGFLWCLIVIAAVAYCWLAVPLLLRRRRNFAARSALVTTLTCLFIVALDMIIGYQGWSVTYVVPGLLTTGIASITVAMVFNRTNRAQYVLYQVFLAVFGFVPLVLYVLDLADNLILVIIAAGTAFASLLGTIVFGDRTIKNEFKRRFHF